MQEQCIFHAACGSVARRDADRAVAHFARETSACLTLLVMLRCGRSSISRSWRVWAILAGPAPGLAYPSQRYRGPIQNLETDLGVTLLNRHSKDIVLTPEGTKLVDICATIQRSIDRMAMIGPKAAARASTTIGIPVTLSSLLLGAVFERVSLLWPADAFRFQEASSATIERDVLSQGLDFGLVYDSAETDELQTIPLVGETLAFICSPKWDIAASGQNLRLRDVLHLPAILPSPGQHERRVILKAEAKGGFRLDPIIEIDTPSTIRSLVHDGLGYTLATPQSVSEEVKRGRPGVPADRHAGAENAAARRAALQRRPGWQDARDCDGDPRHRCRPDPGGALGRRGPARSAAGAGLGAAGDPLRAGG